MTKRVPVGLAPGLTGPGFCTTQDESPSTDDSSCSIAANSAGVRYPSAPCGDGAYTGGFREWLRCRLG